MAIAGENKLRKRKRTARIAFYLLLIFSLLVFLSGRDNPELMQGTKSRVDDVTAPVMTYLTMPIRGLEDAFGGLSDRARAHRENTRLKAELTRLSDIEARANAMSLKLNRFEQILKVESDSGIPATKVAARAVTETNGPFVRSSLLNAGSSKGVTKGNAVMTADGLLGHVVRVGQRSSRVLHLGDLNSRVAVMSLRSGERAILSGDNSDSPILSYISAETGWVEGDEVVTSGDGGMLPQGLPVGVVRRSDDETLRVILSVARKPVDWVWIYPFDPVPAPEEYPDVTVDDQSSSGETGG